MTLERESLGLLIEAADELERGFASLPPFEPGVDREAMRAVLLEVAKRMGDNFPYAHPLYAGQMLKPPHPIARLAYALSLFVNPNNHALDGGRASSGLEREAVAELASMLGLPRHLGHLCSGGTMANLEALWVSGSLEKGGAVLASDQAHYTHERVSAVLGLPFEAVASDARGRMSVAALRSALERKKAAGETVAAVVVTLGTTALGAVDPLPEVLALREEHRFRIHVDAAYGGYFRLASNLSPEARAAFDRSGEADSIAIDPHKHGLQPYGCGCVLFADPAVGTLYAHDSPYTYFSSAELHLGEITLECSRPGASAVALWATHRLLPLRPGGELARGLEASRRAALGLWSRLSGDARFRVLAEPELDIVVWAPSAPTAREASAASRRIFEAAARRGLHLALTQLPRSIASAAWPELAWDAPHLTALRSVLMKPEHEAWLEAIWLELDRAAAEPPR